MKLVSKKTFVWGLAGAWAGALMGLTVLFIQYMLSSDEDDPRTSRYFLAAHGTSGDGASGLLSGGSQYTLRWQDEPNVIRDVALGFLACAQTTEAIQTLELIASEDDRASAFVALLPKKESSPITDTVRDERETLVQSLKVAIPKLFTANHTQSQLLVEVAKAFIDLGLPADARVSLQEARQKLSTRPTGASPSPRNSSLPVTPAPANIDTPSKPWPGWWPVGLAAIGFCAAAMLKPVIEALGKLLLGTLVVQLTKSEQLRKLLSLEAKTDPKPATIEPDDAKNEAPNHMSEVVRQ